MRQDAPVSDALIGAAATLAGVFAGGGLQALQQRAGHRARREEASADRLWAARRDAYAEFLVAFNNAAHTAGNLAPRPGRAAQSGAEARELADYFFDENVTPALRSLEIVGTTEAAERARTAAAALSDFRDRMTHPNKPAPPYRSDEYNASYEPARAARLRFQERASAELSAP